MKARIITAAVLGAASLGLSQGAMANWQSNDCDSTLTRPCIELNQSPPGRSPTHFTPDDPQTGTPAGSARWHGYPDTGGSNGTWNNNVNPADPFVFKGPTNLVCGGIPVDCDLELSGYVNITPPQTGQTNYDIGIMVTDADVTGGPFTLCGVVEVSGFPWYIDTNSSHGPYTASGGIPYTVGGTPPIDLIGSIGPIGVYAPLVADVVGGHMHDVRYNNLNAFSFGQNNDDANIYINDPTIDTPTGCTVEGVLTLQSPGQSLVIH